MPVLKFILLGSCFLLISCAKETFQSTCLGFSKSQQARMGTSKDHKEVCKCLETEISNVSVEGKESLRQAMSAGILSQSRFDSRINKAKNDGSLTQQEHQTFELANGKCFGGLSVEEGEVNNMIEQFKALQ